MEWEAFVGVLTRLFFLANMWEKISQPVQERSLGCGLQFCQTLVVPVMSLVVWFAVEGRVGLASLRLQVP